MPVKLKAVLALLASLCVGLTLASTASATGTALIGKAKLGANRPTGQPVLLIPVRYPLRDSGHPGEVRINMHGPGLKPRGFTRTSHPADIHAGPLRSPDLRKSFTFVHSIGVPRNFSAWFSRHASKARFTITAVSYEARDQAGSILSRGSARQKGIRRAAPEFCSTPTHEARPGAKLGDLVTLPVCGTRFRWSIGDGPDRGKVSVEGGLARYESLTGAGRDRFEVVGTSGDRSVSIPVETRLASDPDSISVRALGDSVTAGFGYFGSTGRAMILGQLLDCKPGATVYNDACSSNSSNRTNVGSDPNYLPDYGLSRNISWPAVWANSYGITDYKNYAVSGSAPSDWLPGGQFHSTLQSIEAENPDYVMLTLGANPLLSDMLFGVDEMGCAIYSDLEGDYKACIESAFDSVDLAGKLNAVYTDLVNKTTSKIVLMQYHLSIPSSAIAYTTGQIATMGDLMNEVIAEQAAAVSTSRISVISPPHFNVGINMDPIYPSKYKCTLFGSRVDGPSVQSTPTQDEFELLDPVSFCSGPSFGSPWVISGDTGIHPSFSGYAQMADQIPAPG